MLITTNPMCYNGTMVTSRYPKPKAGDQFGMFTVVDNIKLSNRWMVKVRCACGDESLKRLGHLHGSPKKKAVAGCWDCTRKNIGLSQRDYSDTQARTAVWHNYRTKAAQRNLNWELGREEFWAVAERPCVYCGNIKTSYFNQPRSSPWAAPYVYTGVDRVDSAEGYVASNVQPCCKWCNMAKSDRTEKEFLTWAKSVYYNQQKLDAAWG